MQPEVSFVVIGRNQAATICSSLESTFRAAQAAKIRGFETIYVDSDSSDGSVSSVLERFGGSVVVVRLTGARNAGIGRNLGAKFASGRVLFFVDGDMEVDPEFLNAALDPLRHDLIHPIVTGQLPEKIYDVQGQLLRDAPDRYGIRSRVYQAELGGIFLIDRQLFAKVGGFAAEMRCNEDVDLGLRLARGGTLTLALAQPIALHHTVDYFDWRRLWRMIRDGSLLYPGVLFRRHATSRHYLPILLSNQRSTVVLVAAVALAIFTNPGWLLLYVAYLCAKHLRRRHLTLAQDMAGTTARSMGFVLGLIGFYPAKVPACAITFEQCGRQPKINDQLDPRTRSGSQGVPVPN